MISITLSAEMADDDGNLFGLLFDIDEALHTDVNVEVFRRSDDGKGDQPCFLMNLCDFDTLALDFARAYLARHGKFPWDK